MAGQTFTTYINAKRTSSIDTEFAAVDARAQKTLSGIQQKAEAASKAMAGLVSGRGNGGLRSSPVGQSYLKGLDDTTAKTDRLAAAQRRLERENSQLVRSLRTSAQTLQIVQGPLGPIAGRVSAAADAIARLSGVTLGLAGAGAALFAYTSAANKFVDIRSRLAPLYDTQQDVNRALSEVAGIAQRARVGLEPVVDLYARLKLAADQYGISQNRIGRITELATKAARLSGGSSQSQEAGLYQFAQGFGSGSLGGDELKSVRENTLGLARALSQGLAKLPEFKGVDTSIGKLKELGSTGKLTADVIARAMEASSAQVEASFAKLPPTLSSSFTALQTNATMFVGRFEQATGIVGTLASAVGLLANNISPLVALVGGLAAAWVSVAAAQRAGQTVDTVKNAFASARAQQTSAKAALETAVNQRTATAQRNVQLAQEQAQIRLNIVALEAELAVQRQIAAQGSVSVRAGLPGGARQLAEGQAGTARVTRQLANEVEHLSTVQTTAATGARQYAGQTAAVGIATTAAAKSSSLLRMGMSSLLGAINPVGIAVALATTAFLAWATAESEAEKNAKKVEDAQRKLATVIDQTTGKIIEQNVALRNAAAQQGMAGAVIAKGEYQRTRGQITGLGAQFEARREGGDRNPYYVTPNLSGTQTKARDLLRGYANDPRQSVASLEAGLNALAKVDPSLRALAARVTDLGGTLAEQATKAQVLAAGSRVASGSKNPEDERRAIGDFSGGRVRGGAPGRNLEAEAAALGAKLADKRFAAETQRNEAFQALEKKKGQMQADDYVRERAQIIATYNSALAGLDKQDASREAKHQRELARIEARKAAALRAIEAETAKRVARTEKRSDILGQFSEEPKAVVRARDKTDDLNKLVGQTMDGIKGGIYTQEMADGDAKRIGEGLLRPFTDYLEAQDRGLNIARLRLAGHDLEAEALGKAYDLYEQIGAVTVGQYQAILHSLEAEQKVNDALAQRERILAPLREAVGQLRSETTSALEQILNGGSPAKSVGGFVKGLFKDFNHITAVQLAEKITGGLDARVRDLITGQVKVDGAIADYVGALHETGNATSTFVDSLNSASAAAEHAASALNNVGQASSSPIAAAAAAAGVPGLDSILPKSFYKSGVKVGSGIGDNVIFKALGAAGAVITENLRSQSTQDAYYRSGKTTAKVSDHTTTPDAYDVRLPIGMAFAEATRLIKKAAASMGAEVVKALDETMSGGTGRHGHYVIRPDGSAQAGGATPGSGAATAIGGVVATAISQTVRAVAKGGPATNKTPTANASGVTVDESGAIVVTGSRRAASVADRGGTGGLATATQLYNTVGKDLGGKLDKLFGTKGVFGKAGASLGKALGGAQTGAMVAGIGKMFWSKFSTTGSEIGGAIGKFIPIPGGDIIGSIIGGTIGGLLKKPKTSSAIISSAGGEFTAGKAGGTKSYQAAVNQAAGGVVSGLQSVADQLGGAVGNFGNISVGQYKGNWRVNTSGGAIGGKHVTGTLIGASSEEDAVRIAIEQAIGRGAIAGISAASQNILKSGQDLQKALTKALVIESIPKRLMAIKDPVRFAIMQLNEEFSKMIAYLKEGGATAEQFTQAQELYDLSRKKAIEEATNNSTKSIQDFLDNMLNSQSSPLNKKTVYDNAKTTLDKYTGDVQAGKAVDTDALLKATTDFQEASRALNGSDSSFFTDFNFLVGLLQKAKANVVAGQTATGDLPASPFTDAQVQQIITGTTATTDAINYQTTYLGGLLGQLVNGAAGAGTTTGGSAINLLPGGGGGGCVTADTVLPSHGAARDVMVGDCLLIANPTSFAERQGRVSYAALKDAPCVRVTTSSGIELECSLTAPIANQSGDLVLAPDLLGESVPVCDHGLYRYETVVKVEYIGVREIVHITCENDLFLAGRVTGRYLLHHNMKAIPDAGF